MSDKFEVEYRRFSSWNSMSYTDKKATFDNAKSMLHFYDNTDWGNDILAFQCIRHNGKHIKYFRCGRYSHEKNTDINELAKYREEIKTA